MHNRQDAKAKAGLVDVLMLLRPVTQGADRPGKAREGRGAQSCHMDMLQKRLRLMDGVAEVARAVNGRALHVWHDPARVRMELLLKAAVESGCEPRLVAL